MFLLGGKKKQLLGRLKQMSPSFPPSSLPPPYALSLTVPCLPPHRAVVMLPFGELACDFDLLTRNVVSPSCPLAFPFLCATPSHPLSSSAPTFPTSVYPYFLFPEFFHAFHFCQWLTLPILTISIEITTSTPSPLSDWRRSALGTIRAAATPLVA